jgi:hypothetical protein
VVNYFSFGRSNNVAGSGGIFQKKNIFRQYRYKRYQEPVFPGPPVAKEFKNIGFWAVLHILASAVYIQWRIRAVFIPEREHISKVPVQYVIL